MCAFYVSVLQAGRDRKEEGLQQTPISPSQRKEGEEEEEGEENKG